MKQFLTNIFLEFTRSERSAGLLLIICTIFSLTIANNNNLGEKYIHFWHQNLNLSFVNFEMNYPLKHWIDDGLMTIFFLLVGLEIERELYAGELHPIKNAIIPIVAAIGGMLAPAIIYSIVNYNLSTIQGFGIPMATDIAFSLAILSLVSNKVPFSIKILLTSLAIIDDLGAITVIALFYGEEIHWAYLFISLSIFIILLIMNRLKIYYLTPYLLLGLPMWYFMMNSGIHASIAGVLLAFAIPFSNGNDDKNPSIKLQEALHIPVGFIILPLFILANTAIPIKIEYINSLLDKHSLGIGLGLCLGKPIGIFLSIYTIVKLKIVELPKNVNWYNVLSLGVLAGIGFTMSIFITHLAFNDNETLIQSSKIMILISAIISSAVAYMMFLFSGKRKI